MYIELHNEFKHSTGRYRYVPVEITPQDFHRNRYDDTKTMLIVDNPELTAAVREEYPFCYGSINLCIEDCEIDCCSFYRPFLFLRMLKDFVSGDPWDCVPVIVTDEELAALVRMRYPQESKDPAFIDNIIQEYHFQTNGEIVHIKIDNPPPGLTELF